MFGRVILVFHHEFLGPPLFGYVAFCGKGYFVLHVEGKSGMMTRNTSFCFVIHNIGGLGLFWMILLCSCQVCVIV